MALFAKLAVLVAIATSFAATPARASTLTYDCDVLPDHFSSVTSQLETPFVISGTVRAIEFRSGDYLALAGFGVDADNGDWLSVRLLAEGRKAKNLAIEFTMQRNGQKEDKMAGKVDASGEIPFSLALTETGNLTVQLGGSSFRAAFSPQKSALARVFCSTAQFKFANLRLNHLDP